MSEMDMTQLKVSKTEAIGRHGMVAGGHALEVETGIRILQQGGNAIDAMAAAAFVAWVVEPSNSSIAGLGLMNIYLAHRNECVVIDHLHRAPLEASPDMYELEDGLDDWDRWRRVKDNANMVGYLSIAVPGALAGVCAALERYGTMPLKDIIAPAIALAEDGFFIDGYEALTIGNRLANLRRFPHTLARFTQDGAPLHPGSISQGSDRLVQKDLARTLRQVAEEGPATFYQGELAHRIVRHIADHGGILSLNDLNAYQALVRPAQLMHSYQGYRYTCSDTAYTPLILNILECFDLSAMGPDDPDYYHLMIEAQRRAFAECLEHLTDPDGEHSPLRGMLSKEYAAEIANHISLHTAASQVEPGDPWPYEQKLTGRHRPAPILKNRHSSSIPGTTEVVTMDNRGNIVTLVTTLGGAFGSMVTIPDTGIVLNNGMISLDPEPGHANSIYGGRRVVSFVPPTLMFDNHDQPFLALGVSGSRCTVSAIAHIVCNVVSFGMGIQDAIAAPRVHCELRQPFVDTRLPPAVIRELERRGHVLIPCEETSFSPHFGRPVGILRDPADGLLHGGAAPLLRAVAAGY